jgi:cation diffusion facilitator CzcD-associated flavoprotein CzcO
MSLIEQPTEVAGTPTAEHEVIVVGAGFAGIGTAIKLGELGIQDYLVIEEGDDVGGTWHWNRYPGVAVDIPSFSYQFSFAPRSDWSRVYAPGEELRGYARDLVEEYGLREHLRFGTRITEARYDEQTDRWQLLTDAGETLMTRFVILATGILSRPRPVDIPGLDTFAGQTIHTARWDDGVQLTGRQVAVIGTGASAVQLIPAIAADVAKLTVFQRTPIWCLPKFNGPLKGAPRRILERVPVTQKIVRGISQTLVELQFPLALHFPRFFPVAAVAERIARRTLRHQVPDPVLREKLTPQYTVGCKRPSFHNSYLSTFSRDNVELETTPIARITASGIETTDGTQHEVDVLVLATGFKVFETGSMPPFPTSGVGGRDLDAFWTENRYQSYQGVSVPGFPNLFMISGPFGYNGASYFTLIENQLRHIGRVLGRARRESALRVEVKPEANDRYMATMRGRRHHQVLVRGNCGPAKSYYFDAQGDSPFRVSPTVEARWRSGRFDLDDYAFTRVSARELVT